MVARDIIGLYTQTSELFKNIKLSMVGTSKQIVLHYFKSVHNTLKQ